MVAKLPRPESTVRERLLDAAYNLFAHRGVSQVGIDTILAQAGCAKASLYSHFGSKVELARAFLARREEVWTRGWLEAEIVRRARTPDARLLVVFDVFDGWFRRRDFEGCSFVDVLLESHSDGPVYREAAAQLAKIRTIIEQLAHEARLADAASFAHAWHMLMKGAIVSAREGNRDAARHAKRAGRLVLEGWPRERGAVARRG